MLKKPKTYDQIRLGRFTFFNLTFAKMKLSVNLLDRQLSTGCRVQCSSQTVIIKTTQVLYCYCSWLKP